MSEYANNEVTLMVARDRLELALHVIRGTPEVAFLEGAKTKHELLSMLDQSLRNATRMQRACLRHLIERDNMTGEIRKD